MGLSKLALPYDPMFMGRLTYSYPSIGPCFASRSSYIFVYMPLLHWLENLDKNKKQSLPILAKAYGEKNASMWFERWRVFFLSCAELFGYNKGQEWMVAHYLFEKTSKVS